MFKSLAKAFEVGLKLTKHNDASATNFFVRNLHTTPTNHSRLVFMHERAGGPSHRPKTKMPICGDPQLRGVVLKVLILKPKKPNSGNRKCVLVRLSNGKEVKAYVPGEAHNLQEHSVVLVEGGKKKDLMGVNCRVMRGKFDCNPTKRKEKEIKKFAAIKKSA